MKNALTRLLSSAKVWTTLIGMLATAGASLLARYGLELSTEAVQQIAITVAAMFGILLHAQGKADQGKEAAKVAATAPAAPQTAQINEATIAPPPA